MQKRKIISYALNKKKEKSHFLFFCFMYLVFYSCLRTYKRHSKTLIIIPVSNREYSRKVLRRIPKLLITHNCMDIHIQGIRIYTKQRDMLDTI